MKLLRVRIENFRGLRDLEVNFQDAGPNGTRPLTAVLGDNGSGKTTLLQALALPLSMATRRTRRIEEFDWPGFVPERVSSLGKTWVELDVEFDAEEVAETGQLFREWLDHLIPEQRQRMKIVPPATHGLVTLHFDGSRLTSPQGLEGLVQFLGRNYAHQLPISFARRREIFRRVGDVVWFDQFRSLGTATPPEPLNSSAATDAREAARAWSVGVEHLREQLVGAWSVYASGGGAGRVSVIPELLELLQRVSPGVQFRGTAPRGETGYAAQNLYFLLERQGRVYDLGEMSSGEQAVFPLLWRFVYLRIAKSILLIDELELHLHPPQQQALLAALLALPDDNQFLITTHSPYLESVIPNEWEVRLEGGRRCL